MTQTKRAKLQVLNQLLMGQMTVREVAQVLGSSERHTWPMLAAYRKEGAAALVHGNRSRQPANAIPRERPYTRSRLGRCLLWVRPI